MKRNIHNYGKVYETDIFHLLFRIIISGVKKMVQN